MYQIYKITNTINNKIYIGLTQRTLKRRFQDHCCSSGCAAMSNAIKKYGKENFIIESLMGDIPSKEEAGAWEEFCIEGYNSLAPNGYNIAKGGAFGLVGFHHSEESKKKMSESKKGSHHTEETKKRLSEVGKKKEFSLETRLKISKSKVGNKSFTGIKHSEETKQKIAKARRGKKLSVEHIEKITCKFKKGHIPWNKGLKMGDNQ